ncbi:MAG: hypothetical protein L6Q95_06710 [Planctomycetes bacterium]|nr:hypothetical protein [Planctomycetota bacterium]
MRRVVLLALLAPVASADSRVERIIDYLNAGRTDDALEEVSPEVMRLLPIMDDLSRQAVHAMIAHNERYAGKDDYACGRVLELGREVRKAALERGDAERRILAAEILLLEGRTARARREADWFASWRAAAGELAAWHEGSASRDQALVRAVQILAEGAELKGAPPAEQVLEEARQIVLGDSRGESAESPAYLAYLVSLAEHHVRNRRKKEAAEALAPFDEIGPKLGGREDDLDRATVFNLAVSLSRREGLSLKAGFKTTREKAARVEFDLPVSRLWDAPRDTWADGAMVGQIAPDGRLVGKLYANWYEPGTPWDHDTPEPKTLQRLGELRIGAIRDFDMMKIGKKSGPGGGSLSRHLPKGLLSKFEGVDKHGRAVASRHLLFEEKKRGPGFFEVSAWVYGERAPADPLFEETVASFR